MTPAIARVRGICSGQNLIAAQNHDMCSTVPGVSQADIELDIPVSLYSTSRRGDLRTLLPPTSTTIRLHLGLRWLSAEILTFTRHSSAARILRLRRGYDVTISPCSKYSLISVGQFWILADTSACQSQQSSTTIWAVMEGSQRVNRADSRNPYPQLQHYMILIPLKIHEERGRA